MAIFWEIVPVFYGMLPASMEVAPYSHFRQLSPCTPHEHVRMVCKTRSRRWISLFRGISLSAVHAESLALRLVTGTGAGAVDIDLSGVAAAVIIIHTFLCLTLDVDLAASTAGYGTVGHGAFGFLPEAVAAGLTGILGAAAFHLNISSGT